MIFRVTKLITRRPCKAGFFLLFYLLYLLLGICRILFIVVIVVKLYLVNVVHVLCIFNLKVIPCINKVILSYLFIFRFLLSRPDKMGEGRVSLVIDQSPMAKGPPFLMKQKNI